MNAPDCICSPGRLPLGAFCAGRDDLEREALHDDRISIRAPRAGCDQAAATKKGFMSEFQSTRPVWGATGFGCLYVRPGSNFNPRAPCGARQWALVQEDVIRQFQSTRPVWGATPKLYHLAYYSKFQSTRPVWGATLCTLFFGGSFLVFQSTRPVWGATHCSMRFVCCIWYFNPRAPCGARPHIPCICGVVPRDFNPRAPCGARRCDTWISPRLWYFNPRAPCGARLGVALAVETFIAISIHAPRVGRDSRFSSNGSAFS